ncbi:MAG: glutaredoxin domain-containing protein [Myxococcota bacterium]
MKPLAHVHPHALAAREAFHADTVAEVARTVERDDVVVVGMAWNLAVIRARRVLKEKGVPFTYLEYGNYLSGWRKRLAIKLWSGWPTFPQIFVKGQLVGGCSDMVKLLEKGELTLPKP